MDSVLCRAVPGVVVVIALLSCTLCITLAAAAGADMKFYMQGHYTNVHRVQAAPILGYMANETLLGVLAAFHEVNSAGGLAGGRNFTVKLADDGGQPDVWGVNGSTAMAMNDPTLLGAVTALGPIGFFVNPIARQLRMPVFGPTTINQNELLQTTPNSDFLIHVRVPILSDVLAALNYAMNGDTHCKSFMVVYIDEFGIKDAADTTLAVLASLGLEAPVVVGVSFANSGKPTVLVPLVLSRYLAAATKPSCGLFMMDGAASASIILGLASALPAAVFADFHSFTTSAGSLPRWVDPTTGSTAAFKNVYITGSHPAGIDRRYKFVQHYQKAMATLKAEVPSLPVSSLFIPNVFSVDGYMAARVLIEAVRRIGIGEAVTRQRLKDVVYETKMFKIDDIVLGPFSNGCVGQETSATGECWCTSGMKKVFLSRVDGATGFTTPIFDPPYFPGIAETPMPLIKCDLDATAIRRSSVTVVPRDVNLDLNTAIIGDFSNTGSRVELQTRAVASLRAEVLAALKANTLVGALVAVSFQTQPYAPTSVPPALLNSSAVSFTTTTLAQLHSRYRLVFLMAAVYDPAKVYPQLAPTFNDAGSAPAVTTQSATSTLPPIGDEGVHLLDIAPATSAFKDQDDPWLPPSAHLPLRIPFYPTLADFSVTAAAFAVNKLQLGGSSAAGSLASNSTSDAATNRRISVIADSAAIGDVATKAVETFARVSPASVSVAPASGSVSEATELDALFQQAVSRATAPSANTIGGSSSWKAAVVVATRRGAVMDAAVRAAAQPWSSTVAVILAADEFALEGVFQRMSVDPSTSSSTPSNLFFISGLPKYAKSTAAGANDTRASAVDSYSGAIASTVKALYDLSVNNNGSAIEIATAAYRNLALPVAAAEITMSPLWADKCTGITKPTWPHPGGECQCAKGLNTFFVRSFKDAVENSTSASTGVADYSYRHAGCGPEFKALDPPVDSSSGLSSTQLVLIAAGGVIVLVTVAVAGVVLWMAFCRPSARDNSNAPKDAAQPFTMVFTDIQSSTKLWAHAPDRMGEALDAHHHIMREAVKKHKGYEVKTIGDSFMVAFKHPKSALQFSFDVQLMLYNHTMDTEVFDDIYREAIADAAGEEQQMPDIVDQYSDDGEHEDEHQDGAAAAHWIPCADKNTSDDLALTKKQREPQVAGESGAPGVGGAAEKYVHTQLDAADYAALWSGLRVRVGIHHGTGNIRLDETSLGYDYYGTVVNTAARVEGVGHGGQVLLTEAAYECLGDEAVAQVRGVTTDLGPQPLRGLPAPVRLIQVLPEAFAGRRFPPLRLDVENDVDADETTGNESGKNDALSKRSSGGTTTTATENNRLGPDDVFAELAKRLRLQSPSVSKLPIAATFDAVLTLMAPMKSTAQKDTLKSMSSAWRAQSVWSAAHLKRIERTSPFTSEQLTLLAAVGRAVQALEVQTRGGATFTTNAHPAQHAAAKGEKPPLQSPDASIISAQQKTTAFAPGAGYAAVLRELKKATAQTLSPRSPHLSPRSAALQGGATTGTMLPSLGIAAVMSEGQSELEGSTKTLERMNRNTEMFTAVEAVSSMSGSRAL